MIDVFADDQKERGNLIENIVITRYIVPWLSINLRDCRVAALLAMTEKVSLQATERSVAISLFK